MIALRRVVDNNIILAAVLRAGRASGYGSFAITKPALLCVTDEIIAEYRDVLSRAELKIRKGLRPQLVQLIRNHAYPVKRHAHFTSRVVRATTSS